MPTHLWVRAEVRPTERRAPVVPDDVGRLVAAGFQVTVEESAQRAFDINAYAEAGATVVPTGSWVEAPDDVVVVGIKELPDEPAELRHRHVFFAHALKGQSDASTVLDRFRSGGGVLLDIEYLTDPAGRRLVAFGYWAGTSEPLWASCTSPEPSRHHCNRSTSTSSTRGCSQRPTRWPAAGRW